MAFCKECGNALESDGVSFCPQCGTKVTLAPLNPTSEPVESWSITQSVGLRVNSSARIPTLSIVVVAAAAIVSAFGNFQYEPLLEYHPPLQRLILVASGLCLVLFGIGSMMAFRWASSRSHGASAVLIGVGLILSSAWYLVIGIVLLIKDNGEYYPSILVQNVITTISIVGWIIVAVGVLLTLKRTPNRT